jgi:hypothetical protein
MKKGKGFNNWTFGFLWLLANTIGWGLKTTLAGFIGQGMFNYYQNLIGGYGIYFISNDSNRSLVTMVFFGLALGAVIGALQ